MATLNPASLPPWITADAIAIAEGLIQAYTTGTGSIQLAPASFPIAGKTATLTPGPIAVTIA